MFNSLLARLGFILDLVTNLRVQLPGEFSAESFYCKLHKSSHFPSTHIHACEPAHCQLLKIAQLISRVLSSLQHGLHIARRMLNIGYL